MLGYQSIGVSGSTGLGFLSFYPKSLLDVDFDLPSDGS